MGITVSMRAYFSSYYLWSAEHHAQMAKAIEDAHSEGPPRFSVRHRSYVLSTVTDAVAFVESSVNEVLQDVEDDHRSYIEPIDAVAAERLRGYWRSGSARSTLSKYEETLSLCEKPPIPKGSAPWQDMRVLTELRNALVHYKPVNRSDAFEAPKLVKRLATRFADNALMQGSGNAWFPDKALGAGCCTWACSSARTFVDDWSSRMGLTLNYQRVTWDEVP